MGRGWIEVLTILETICTHCFLRSKTSSAKIMSTLRGTLSSSCEETVRGEGWKGSGGERRGGEGGVDGRGEEEGEERGGWMGGEERGGEGNRGWMGEEW